MAGKKKRKGLSKEDNLLWKKVTQNVTPLHKTSTDLEQNFLELFEKQNEIKKGKVPTISVTTNQHKKPLVIEKKIIRPVLKQKQLTSPVGFLDKQTKSRLARGIKYIDARLDLHGMTQKQAYQALSNFLERAQQNNFKNVLVITGKGNSSYLERQEASFSWHEEPGVLRRKLPDWLQTEKLRNFVTRFDEAAPNHGGSGAFYIVIRKRR